MRNRARTPRGNLATEIANAIRDGSYRSGEWLRQIDLEERFKAKRFAVRTALSELALRGTVERVPNRGYRVSTLSLDQMREILAIRALLEVEASTQAIANMTPDSLRKIRDCASAFEKAIYEGHIADQAQADTAFHDAIYERTPNRKLAAMVRELRDQAAPSPILMWPSLQSLKRSADDHRRIVKAFESRDCDAVAEAVRLHIIDSEPHVSHFGGVETAKSR